MTSEEELAAAEAKSRAARRQLTATMVDIQQRLNPRVLVREALSEAREAGSELLRAGLSQARQNPGPLIGIAAAVTAYLARDWFTAKVRRVADPAGDTQTASADGAASADDARAGRVAEMAVTDQPPADTPLIDGELINPGVKRPPRRKR